MNQSPNDRRLAELQKADEDSPAVLAELKKEFDEHRNPDWLFGITRDEYVTVRKRMLAGGHSGVTIPFLAQL